MEQKTALEAFNTVAYLEGLRIDDPIAHTEMLKVIGLEKQREEYERAEIETAQSIQHAGGESR